VPPPGDTNHPVGLVTEPLGNAQDMSSPRDPSVDPRRDESEHPDEITQREGLEQELLEEGRSEDGEEIGEHID
jgi:hypothetical protein